ncbi:MAG TPA: diacylglycerol kinase family protein [Acidimicrobiia bacterium]|nr:diacylglycerol kinase family protein [Acidimicrobiia bacterium]
MRRLVLIANPVASGFTASLHREVVATLTGPYDVQPVWPNSAADARRAAAEAAADGIEVVGAMGGDGVAHQVANGLLGTPTALGIIPAGTTNVLARVLGLPSKPVAAAGHIADLPGTRPIPVAAVEDDSAAGVRHQIALFNVGVGLDAAIVRRAESRPLSKVGFGALHYARSTAAVVVGDYRRRKPNLVVDVDGRSLHAVTVLVQVHDIHSFFGPRPLRLGPPAPGLTVAVAKRTPILRTVRMVGRALTGRSLDAVPGVTVIRGARSVSVDADPETLVQADGELLGTVTTASITLSPEPLLVVASP